MLSIAQRLIAKEAIAFEFVACPSCGGESAEPVLSAADPSNSLALPHFDVVCCTNCRLHYTNPRPSTGSIGRYYGADYRPHTGKAKVHRPLRGWYPLDWLRTPPPGDRRPRLLDFGCGAGHFLAGMDRQGWEAVGIDASESAVQAVRETVGLPAFAGSLPHDELEPATFDLVTLWHSLEHVHDPASILREARRLLVESGRLIVAVPNFAGWPRRWFGPNWYGLDLPRHLTHFTPETLRNMLEQARFRVLGMRHPRHPDWVRSSALLAQKRSRTGSVPSLARLRPVARLAAGICQIFRASDVIMVLAERS